MNTLDLTIEDSSFWVFLAYLILLFAIGIYASKYASKGIKEYFIAGRTLNKYVVALSAVVSGRSAWLLLSFSAITYVNGVAAVWAVLGYIIVEFWMFRYFAPRFRCFSETHEAITIPDFFVAKFGDKNNLLRYITAGIILVFMVIYIATQLSAGGLLFASSFDISQSRGRLITAIIILSYTLFGGFLAVSMTDVLQAVIILLSLIIVPIVSITVAGGWTVVAQGLVAQKPNFFDPFSIALGSIVGFLGIGLGSFGSPHIMVRYGAIKDSNSFETVAIIGTILNILMAVGALLTGFAARAYFPSLNIFVAGDIENAYPTLAKYTLNPVLFGVVISSIFAAIMSTIDSQLLVAASALVRDIYQKVMRQEEEVSNTKLITYSRLAVLLITIIALLLAFWAEQHIWVVLFAWGGLGASIGSTALLTLFWSGTTRQGVIAGMLTGIVSIFIWKNIPVLDALMYELIPTFFLTFMTTIIVSRYTSAR